MRKVAGRLKLELAAVPRPRGLRAVRLRARRRHPAHAGPRRPLVATLNQPAYAPWPVEEQVAIDLRRQPGRARPHRGGRRAGGQRADPPRAPRRRRTCSQSIRDTKDLSDETPPRSRRSSKKVATSSRLEDEPTDAAVRREPSRPRRPRSADGAPRRRRPRPPSVADPARHQAADRLGPQHAEDHPRHGARRRRRSCAARRTRIEALRPYAQAMRRADGPGRPPERRAPRACRCWRSARRRARRSSCDHRRPRPGGRAST